MKTYLHPLSWIQIFGPISWLTVHIRILKLPRKWNTHMQNGWPENSNYRTSSKLWIRTRGRSHFICGQIGHNRLQQTSYPKGNWKDVEQHTFTCPHVILIKSRPAGPGTKFCRTDYWWPHVNQSFRYFQATQSLTIVGGMLTDRWNCTTAWLPAASIFLIMTTCMDIRLQSVTF